MVKRGFMVEKLASSEIAQSRERAKAIVDEECGFATLPEFGSGLRWQIENAVMRAERDTRERCAQIAEEGATLHVGCLFYNERGDMLVPNGGSCHAAIARRIRGKE